jgi:hypothetical protein
VTHEFRNNLFPYGNGDIADYALHASLPTRSRPGIFLTLAIQSRQVEYNTVHEMSDGQEIGLQKSDGSEVEANEAEQLYPLLEVRSYKYECLVVK